MNRLYAVESTPTNTGAMADHRLRLRAAEIESFARALARELGLECGGRACERSCHSGGMDSRAGPRSETASRAHLW